MDLELLFPPTLIRRALEDLRAIADACRKLPELEREVLTRIDDVREEAFGRVDALQAEIVRVRQGVEALRAELGPIQELPDVRRAVEPLPDQLTQVVDGLETLRGDVRPIQQLPAVREAVEPIQATLDELRGDIAPHLARIREGIEPLDDDMRSVRGSIDEIEPLIRQIVTRLGALDKRIESMRTAISPIGELADKIPGVG
jgi:chromosome segregation ATPase